VTPKSTNGSVYREERKALRAYMAILGVITGSLVYGMFHLLTPGNSVLGLGIESFLIAYFWSSYNAILIFVSIREILHKRHERKQYRFPVKLEGEIYNKRWFNSLGKVQLNNLSVTGVGFTANKDFQNSNLMLHFKASHNESIFLPIKNIHRQNRDSTNTVQFGASIADLGNNHRDRLFAYLFIDLPGMQNKLDIPLKNELRSPARILDVPHHFQFTKLVEQ
jgi:hypothetical protein